MRKTIQISHDAILSAALIFTLTGGASAEQKVRRAPPLLLGGGIQPQKTPIRLNPVLPRGALRTSPLELSTTKTRCSLKRPICVASSDPNGEALANAVQILEYAYEEHRFGTQLPSTRASFDSPLVWYLKPNQDQELHLNRLPSRGFDRAEASCVGGIVSLERARTCVMRASLASSSPATAPWLSKGLAGSLAINLGQADESKAAINSSFSHTHLGILTSSNSYETWRDQAIVSVADDRSSRLFQYVEERSAKKLGSAAWLSLSLAATHTEWGRSRWDAEPDLTDVLRATFSGSRNDLARFFDDFAANAYFESRGWGSPIEPNWTLDSTSLPRNVALPKPIEPTGSAYVRVNLAPEHRKDTLALRMHCEAPVSYVWSVTRLSEEDEEINRVPVTYIERGRDAATRIEAVNGTLALLLTGTNMGGVELLHPFDPDNGPHEAHGCNIYVSRL